MAGCIQSAAVNETDFPELRAAREKVMRKKMLFIACLLLTLMFSGCRVKKADLGDGREAPVTIVVLGSSTAAGTGPKDIDSTWVNRYVVYAEGLGSKNRIINLAKGGYTTYHMMPSDHVPPDGRPKPDLCRSITMALHLDPSAVIINLPSNDASYGYTVEEQLTNYNRILDYARRKNVPIWITTTQPRNLSTEGRENLMAMRDSTFSRFGAKAIDFWSGLAMEDGSIDPAFDSGDGVHLNDGAHRILFQRVVDAQILEAGVSDRP
jgi:lysophospholipase L1-like esterase